MNLKVLFCDFLIEDCGFDEGQVEVNLPRLYPRFLESPSAVVVNLYGCRLHFLITDEHFIDCALIEGNPGLSVNASSIIDCVFDFVDLRNPDSLNFIYNKIKDYV